MSKGGGAKIPDKYTITSKVGGDGSTISVDADLDNIRIKELAPIDVTSTIKIPDPIVSQSTSSSDADVKVDVEPLEVATDSKSLIDLKPVAVDSCQTIKLAPLPPTHMEQPYSQHFGFTFLGFELFGYTTSGSYRTILNNAGPSSARDCGCDSRPTWPATQRSQHGVAGRRPSGGIRVRIVDE